MESERVSDRPSDWIPELHDIPISLVNIILYQADTISKNIETVAANSFTDTADEMSEEDALALRRRHASGKRNYKNNKGK
jgi:hypothetical protein